MITWLFDRQNQYGFLPNLINDDTLVPGTNAWWDLCVKKPFSYEFRFLKYCALDKLAQDCRLVSEYSSNDTSAYYPVNINFFDPEIDYFALMPKSTRDRIRKGDFKFLFYYSEGDNPDPEIYVSLEKMCTTHSIPYDHLRFVTANYKLKNEHPFVYFPDDEVYYRYLHVLENKFVKSHNLNQRNKKFTCLNRANKIWRKIYAALLYQLDLPRQGYFSYTNYVYETSHTGLDDIDQWSDFDNDLINSILQFELQLPITCDDLSIQDHNNHKLVDERFFQDAYWNYVVETHFDSDTIFLTEKTFKPILNLQPFILIGNPGSLGLLRDLGYKTFGDVINEAYDEDLDHRNRMGSLLKISFDLCNISDNHHIRIQHALADHLSHNQQHFLAPKVHRIKNFLTELEYR